LVDWVNIVVVVVVVVVVGLFISMAANRLLKNP